MQRRAAFAAAVLLVILGVASHAGAADVAKEVKAAQARANAAAARLARAESALSVAERELGDLQRREQETIAALGSLESRVKMLAVDRYVHGRNRVPSVLMQSPNEAARAQHMLAVVTTGAADDIAAYRVAQGDLAEIQRDVAERVDQRKDAVGALRAERAKVQAELNRLATALKAIEARRAAEAAARSKARSSRDATPRIIGSGAWICPVQGAVAFTNDWGNPRSGGRRHKGTDMFARNGTPVVASVSGTVRHHNSRLGGLSYYLRGDDGNTYFGTHLSRYGSQGRVAAGTVVGYVGASGNARGGSPHLHFEIHPGGGGAVNPYPTVRKYC